MGAARRACPRAAQERIGEAAKRHDCYVVAGMYERRGEDVHNAAVLSDRTGEVAGIHRKMFPTPGEIEDGIMAGTEASVCEIIDMNGYCRPVAYAR